MKKKTSLIFIGYVKIALINLVTQIECTSPSRAPEGCTEYLTGVSGSLISYNWPNAQLANTETSHCIRREEGNKKFSAYVI